MLDNLNYEIGYRKPPKANQFKKGASGNPKGRPKKKVGSSFNALLFAALQKKVAVKENGKLKRVTKRDAMLIQLANKVALGDLKVIRFVVSLMEKSENEQTYAMSLLSNEELSAMEDDLSAEIEKLENGN